MTLPLCATCGSTLKAVRGLSDASLSCGKCGWKSNRASKNELPSKGGADASFLGQIPSGGEARYIFGTGLNIPRPRELSCFFDSHDDLLLDMVCPRIPEQRWLP